MPQIEQESPPRASSTGSLKADNSSVRRYVVCYLLFFVVLAACYVNFFAWDQVVKQIIVTWLSGNLAVEAFYAFSMLFIGLILFGVALISEHLLRTSVAKGRLRATFSRIIGRLLLSAFAAVIIITLISLIFSP